MRQSLLDSNQTQAGGLIARRWVQNKLRTTGWSLQRPTWAPHRLLTAHLQYVNFITAPSTCIALMRHSTACAMAKCTLTLALYWWYHGLFGSLRNCLTNCDEYWHFRHRSPLDLLYHHAKFSGARTSTLRQGRKVLCCLFTSNIACSA